MADELQAHIPTGPNGERMEVRVGSKSLGFTTKDLVSVLVVFVLAGFGYLMAHNVTEGQRQGFAGLAQVLEKMGTYQIQSLEKMSTNQQTLMELVHTNRQEMSAEVRGQNQLLHDQTTHLREEMQAQNRLVHEQSKDMRNWVEIINHNLKRPPEEHLPLSVLPGSLPPPERGR